MTYIERADEFKTLLSERLEEKRFIHSLNVAESAVCLAEKYGADKDKAYIAGLLHDCTKNENANTQLQMMTDDGIILSQTEQSNKKLWHAISGEVYARKVLKIEDKEILGAIRYHTTGKAGMTLLEKIIYIADYISAERDYPDVSVMRELSEKSLEEAALYSLKFSLKNLSQNERVIHCDSVDFYNELIIEKNKTDSERTEIYDRT
ncbi:MAG: bis(5'-nucleosyl)-tetraphosphatase (symmetrical) YqeK [Acutalibacteraceae bacterium]